MSFQRKFSLDETKNKLGQTPTLSSNKQNFFFFLKQHRNSEFNHLFVIKSLSICSSIGPNKGHRNIFRRRKILIAYNQAHISLSFAGLIFGPCLPQFLQTKIIQYFLVFMVPPTPFKTSDLNKQIWRVIYASLFRAQFVWANEAL